MPGDALLGGQYYVIQVRPGLGRLRIEGGGAEAQSVLQHIGKHGGTAAANIVLGRMRSSRPEIPVPAPDDAK